MTRAPHPIPTVALALLVICGPGIFAQEPKGGLVVQAQWVEPLDQAHPTVRLKYINRGSEKIRIELPTTEAEMEGFAGLDVTVDGADASYRSYDPTIDDPTYTSMMLEPGDVREVIVDLTIPFRLPEDWHQLEVYPAKIWWVPTVFATGVTMRRTGVR